MEEGSMNESRFGPKVVLILALIFIIVAVAMFYLGKSLKSNSLSVTPTPTVAQVSPTMEPSPSPEVSEIISSPTIALVSPTPTSEPTATVTPEPTATLTPTPTSSPKPDLYVSEYSFNHSPKMGEAFTVKIGIYNKGNAASSGFWWEWWSTTNASTYACRQRISSLPAKGGQIVYCTYTYGGWSTYTQKVVVDAASEIDESDEANNIYTKQVIPIH